MARRRPTAGRIGVSGELSVGITRADGRRVEVGRRNALAQSLKNAIALALYNDSAGPLTGSNWAIAGNVAGMSASGLTITRAAAVLTVAGSVSWTGADSTLSSATLKKGTATQATATITATTVTSGDTVDFTWTITFSGLGSTDNVGMAKIAANGTHTWTLQSLLGRWSTNTSPTQASDWNESAIPVAGAPSANVVKWTLPGTVPSQSQSLRVRKIQLYLAGGNGTKKFEKSVNVLISARSKVTGTWTVTVG